MVAFVVSLVVVRDTRLLKKYRYTFALLGVLFLVLPLLPGIGRTLNGARLWASIGPLNFQPGELASVGSSVLASYLADHRDLLAAGSVRIGRFLVPALRHLGPLALAWGFSILVMVYEKDLGSSLLFFVSSRRCSTWRRDVRLLLLVGLVLFLVGGSIGYQIFGHVQLRVDTWLDPWDDPTGDGFQIIQSWFAFGTGGFAGTGIGLGNPDKIPNAETDFVFSAIGEELGLIGTVAVIIGFMLLVGSAFRGRGRCCAAVLQVVRRRPRHDRRSADRHHSRRGDARHSAHRNHAAVRLVRWILLVANFIVLALLLRVSDETARARQDR